MINQKMFELGNQGSAIRELFEYGKKRKKEIGKDNVFDFSIGNPSVACPQKVTDGLIDIVKNSEPIALHGYSSAPGIDSVRMAIADYLNKTFGVSEAYNLIYLTPGAAAALTISLSALLDEDDEVIVFAPFFPEYRVFVAQAKGKLVVVPSDPVTMFPLFDEFERAITPKTKAVIINSPNNPTGAVYTSEIIEQLAAVMDKKQREFGHEIYLLSDEPYRDLIYSDTIYPFVTKYYANSLVIYSFSKSLSLPGERVGYVLVGHGCKDKELVFKAICGAGRSLGFVCECTLFQHLINYCLGAVCDISIYKENRDLLYNYLKDLGFQLVYPDGAFYLFMKAPEEDDEHFSQIAKQFELLLVPSRSFGMSGYVRISYCVSKQQILNSFGAFKKLKEYYDGKEE